jgi:hypothetical protein
MLGHGAAPAVGESEFAKSVVDVRSCARHAEKISEASIH